MNSPRRAWRLRASGGERAVEPAARRMFAFSILYLFLLFAMLLVDRGFGSPLALR